MLFNVNNSWAIIISYTDFSSFNTEFGPLIITNFDNKDIDSREQFPGKSQFLIEQGLICKEL